MTSYMKETANILGVEVGEIFKIDGDTSLNNCIFKFAAGFLEISKDKDIWTVADDSILVGLLYRHLSIRKSLWKPAFGEKYYVPSIGNKNSSLLWESVLWFDVAIDNTFYKQGIICKTKEEAIALSKKILAMVQEEHKNG